MIYFIARVGEGLRRCLRIRDIRIGGLLTCVVLLLSIIGPQISPFNPREIMINDRLKPPSTEHLFGTDHLGRDIFSRVIFGMRLSVLIGTSVVALSAVGGICLGLAGGYSKHFGNLLMRMVDGLMAFPQLVLVLVLVAVLGSRLENIMIALSVAYVPRVARVVQAMVLEIKSLDYVSAAVAIGAPTRRVLFLHILPTTIGPVVVQSSFLFAGAVLAEASLSFLGVGLPLGTPSLGVVISEGRVYLLEAPWIVIFPGVMLFIISMGLNILGDGLRDSFDPRLLH
jgi:peptide/nickel transport system permease protein